MISTTAGLRNAGSRFFSAGIQNCLSDIKILDLTRILAGPFCTMLLSDLGAQVIKVEKIGKGDDTRNWGPPFINGESYYYLSINRNKKVLLNNITFDCFSMLLMLRCFLEYCG